MFTGSIWKTSQSLTSKLAIGSLAVLFVVVLAPGLFGIASQASAADDYCTNTARAAFVACEAEADDDYYIALGNCFNLNEGTDDCMDEAEKVLEETLELCPEQRAARIEICGVLGEDPYDPEIDKDNFVNPLEIGKSIPPNPYLPLVPGTVRKYIVKDGDGKVIEKITVEVLKETKEILGVTCIVVHDRVWEIDEGEKSLIEDTFDWLAQDRDGNVWYFGEISFSFEDGYVASIEGSWVAGIDGAKPGIVMQGTPLPGTTYRQEWWLGEAEDAATLLAVDETVTIGIGTFTNCVKTEDFLPPEPDALEHKYFAPGIGFIYETKADSPETLELISYSL